MRCVFWYDTIRDVINVLMIFIVDSERISHVFLMFSVVNFEQVNVS